jgi:hypothetical protein
MTACDHDAPTTQTGLSTALAASTIACGSVAITAFGSDAFFPSFGFGVFSFFLILNDEKMELCFPPEHFHSHPVFRPVCSWSDLCGILDPLALSLCKESIRVGWFACLDGRKECFPS